MPRMYMYDKVERPKLKWKFRPSRKYIPGILFLLITIWSSKTIASGTQFTDLNASQIRDDIILVGTLDNENSIGQTIIGQKPYLSSLKIFLKINQETKQFYRNEYHIFLYLHDQQQNEIAFQEYALPKIPESIDVDFTFAPQSDSLNHRYYLLIKTDAPPNLLSVWVSLYDVYEKGDVFLSENAAAFDLTFWAYYRPTVLFWIQEIFSSEFRRFVNLIFMSFVFLTLGFLIHSLVVIQSRSLVTTIIYSLSLGIATPSVLFTLMRLIGIRINRDTILIFLGILALLVGAKLFFLSKKRTLSLIIPKINGKETAVLGLLFLLAALTRTSQISDLYVTNWVDGIVHQQFITRILERQAISFDTIYPKGFHSSVAFEFLLFGGILSESPLLMGQCLSLLSGITFYLLARKMLSSPFSLFAVAIYWFWTPFPAFLVNWGRYPYLQGLVLIPTAVNIVDDDTLDWHSRNRILMFLLLGIGLTYYGAFLIFAAFVIVRLIHQAPIEGYLHALKKAKWMAVSLIPILFILLLRLKHALEMGVYGQDSTISLFEDGLDAFSISLSHGGRIVWVLAAMGFALALIFNYQKGLMMAEWFILLLALNFFQAALNITVSSVANSIIFLSIPLSLLAGFVLRFSLSRFFWTAKEFLYLCLIPIAISGAYNISGIIQPSTVLFSSADQKAMYWIVHNTPADSIFLINSFYWGNDLAPSDGGGWITFMTGRESIAYDMSNLDATLDNPIVNYLYFGRGYGQLNSEELKKNKRFTLIYSVEGVKIYEREPPE